MGEEANNPDTRARKEEHLELALGERIEFARSTGLERYEFLHESLPELSLDQIDTSIHFLGKRLAAPLLVSGMTGGTDRAAELNRRIASAVAELGLGMGVGSLRVAIEHPEAIETFRVRRVAPVAMLIANIGAVQLNYGVTIDDCRRLVEQIEADALAVHLNPLQEAIQPGGNTDWRGLEAKLAELCRRLELPVIAKEVGCGISGSTARRLERTGVAAIDVSGAGGTCWTAIEGLRLADEQARQVAETFREWGIGTAEAVRAVRAACPALPLIASGGLRNGLEIAKCLGLGADVAAVGRPLIRAAAESAEAAKRLLQRYIRELRLAMFCTGSARPSQLRRCIRQVPSR